MGRDSCQNLVPSCVPSWILTGCPLARFWACPVVPLSRDNEETSVPLSRKVVLSRLVGNPIKNLFFCLSLRYCQLGPKYLLWLLISETVFKIREKVFRCACRHGDMRTCPQKILAATLTLFPPEDYAHHMHMSPPSYESHRRAWITNDYWCFYFRHN